MINNDIQAIVAVDENFGIAKNGQIPWKSKTDLAFFKSKTLNNIVIMGSKTLLSLPNKLPLKNRFNIILTNDKNKYLKEYKQDNISFMDLKEFIIYLNLNNKKETLFVIGGEQIYNILLTMCPIIWLTKIKKIYNCDQFLNINLNSYIQSIEYEDDELQIIKFEIIN